MAKKYKLTREIVLQRLNEGKTKREIADEFNTTMESVSAHYRRLVKKGDWKGQGLHPVLCILAENLSEVDGSERS